MLKRDPLNLSGSLLARLKAGAFLTVNDGNNVNTMTIGWGLVGFLWNKPVFMVPVRTSRHTYGLLERSEDFTVTVPSGDVKEALAFCGTRSGRDVGKFKACGLTTRAGLRTASPVVDVPGTHLECRILFRTALDPAHMDPSLAGLYPERDYHTLYFGEIVACYEL